MRKYAPILAACAAPLVLVTAAFAGTYQTINITGSASQFTNVPVAASNTVNASATLDPITLKITNDSTNLYLSVTFAQPVTVPAGLYLAIDSDNNGATGFSDDGTGIGANTGFANDYPFTQTASDFNTGGTITSASSAAAGTNILQQSLSSDSSTTELISIALDATQVDSSAGGYSGLVFPTTFTIQAYTPNDSPDVAIGPVEYTLADDVAAPEPTSLSLLGLAAVPLVGRRRRRRSGPQS